MNEPRLLRAEEINCRVQSVSENQKTGAVGAVILLYKDARVDMALLDETYGRMNWQRTHETINGNLYCTVSVWDADKASWVHKQDVGVESQTEATKGEASDSFKRAGFNWGIGRELYTAPFVYVPLNENEFYRDEVTKKIRTRPSFYLRVKLIDYNENREITGLTLEDKRGTVRYHKGGPAETDLKPEPMQPATTRDDVIREFCTLNGLTVDGFARLLSKLQDEGVVAAKRTKDMTIPEFQALLKAVKERTT